MEKKIYKEIAYILTILSKIFKEIAYILAILILFNKKKKPIKKIKNKL